MRSLTAPKGFKPFEIELPLLRGAAAGSADMQGQDQVQNADRDEFRDRPAQGDRQIVHHRCDQKEVAEKSIGALAGKPFTKRHGDVLPAAVCFMKDLKVTPDSL